MRKILASFVLGSALLISLSSGASAISFNDVDSHWATQAIGAAIDKGFVDGYPDGSFKPDNTVSRAEFITMLSKSLSEKLQPSGGEWYQPYVNAAVADGVHRYEDFTQDIKAPITRQEMARLVVRATNKDARAKDAYMPDASFVYNATKSGLIQGLGNGELGLEQATTRAQAVTVINRVLDANSGKKLEVDTGAVQRSEVALTGTNFISTVGKKPAKKPGTIYDIGGGVTAKIEETYVLDTTTGPSPYDQLYINGKNLNTKSTDFSNKYIVIFRVNYDFGNRGTSFRILDNFNMAGWQFIYKNEKDTKTWVEKSDSGKGTSYLIFVRDKADYNGRDFLPNFTVMGNSYPLFLSEVK